MNQTKFLNLNCVELANDHLSLLVTQDVGPRILSLNLNGGENLFAELPDVALDCPGKGRLNLWGGHRLWHAPEQHRRTYLPDNQPVEITAVPHGLHIVQPTEAETGLQKSITVTLPYDNATVVVDHTLTNNGMWDVDCAPWAITQLKAGGTAVLPQNTQPLEADGVLPNRLLAIWPYTDLTSGHVQLGNDYVFIHANMTDGMLKIGHPNPVGWLAYWRNGTLFVKIAAFNPAATYYDFGSSTECYCDPRFIELETLGPRTTITSDSSATHREVWHLFTDVSYTTPAALAADVVRLISGE
ncbi:MAG: hypothetical protein GY943_32695 [Chloroflexi bacterium]|nr:hypothetical protein [Chloroflexota bacterium]